MGSSFSSLSNIKDKLYEPLAFPVPECSYTEDLNNLYWVESADMERLTPIIYFHHTESKYTILYSHGNICDLGNIHDMCRKMSLDLNVNVVSYDYPTYGLNKNNGCCTEMNIYNTIYDIYKHLIFNYNIKSNIIILYGNSIGTGPTTWLANVLSDNMNNINSVIIQGGYKSLVSLVSETLAKTSYTSEYMIGSSFDMFDNYHNLPKIIFPVTIIHCANDTIIPVNHAKLNASVTKNLKKLVLIENAGHNILETVKISEWTEALRIATS